MIRSLDHCDAHPIHISNIIPIKAVFLNHMSKLFEESWTIEACGLKQTSWLRTFDGQIWMGLPKKQSDPDMDFSTHDWWCLLQMF